MQMIFCRARTFGLFALILALILLQTGCSKSVNPRIPQANNAAELIGMPLEPAEDSILKKTPDELIASGYGHLSMNNAELARMHFSAAVQKNPHRADAYIGLGLIEQNVANLVGAARFYDKAATVDPENVSALIKLAEVQRLSNKLGKSEKTLLIAIALAPNDLRVLAERAILHDQQENYQLAEPIYRQILARDPKRADILNNLGVSQLLREQYDEAINQFRQALQLDRSNSRIKNNLAAAYALSGDEQNALRVFTGTLNQAQAYNNLGYLYMMNGRLDDAERALHKALELNPRFYTRAKENLDQVMQLKSEAP